MSSARPSAMPRGKVENPPMQGPRMTRECCVSQRQGGRGSSEDPVRPRLGTPSASVPPDRWTAPAGPPANFAVSSRFCLPKLHFQSCESWSRVSWDLAITLLTVPAANAFPRGPVPELTCKIWLWCTSLRNDTLCETMSWGARAKRAKSVSGGFLYVWCNLSEMCCFCRCGRGTCRWGKCTCDFGVGHALRLIF